MGDLSDLADSLDSGPSSSSSDLADLAGDLESAPHEGEVIPKGGGGRSKSAFPWSAIISHAKRQAFTAFPGSEALFALGAPAAAGIASGVAGAAVLPFKGNDTASSVVRGVQGLAEPTEPVEGAVASAAGSKLNPMNWIDMIGQKFADLTHDDLRALDFKERMDNGESPTDEDIAYFGDPNKRKANQTPALGPHAATVARVLPSALMALAGMSQKETPEQPPPASGEVGAATSAPTATQTAATMARPDVPETFENEAPTAAPGASVDTGESLRRERVLREVGLDENVPYRRKSVLTGDPLSASTDYQISKYDTEQGRYMRGLLDNERNKLTDYSEQTVHNTGGTVGGTQSDAIARGESVIDPLEKLSAQYDTQRKALYKAADEKAKGAPVALGGFKGVLDDDSLMTTNPDRVGLRSGLTAYLKKLGIMDDEGNVAGTVQNAESVRKYLNQEWSPRNGGAVAQLKAAIDDDVTKAAGEDIYKQARALKVEQARTLEEPAGIAKLLDSSGPSGINRKVASDNVMRTLETMPPEQFGHVMETLRGITGDLKPAADKAIANIQAHFAQAAHDIGTNQAVQWNSKGYNQYLKNNSEQLKIAFADNPEGLRRLYTANEAGKILRFDPSYPGASAQATNVIKSGALPRYLQSAATWGGGALGAFLTGGNPAMAAGAAALGKSIGAKAAARIADKQAMKAVTERAEFEVPK